MFHYKSKITKKLAKKMLHTYLILFTVILIGSIVFLLPYFFNTSKQRASVSANLLGNSYSELQSSMANTLYILTSLNNLSDLLQQYNANPTQQNSAKIEIYMDNFTTSNLKLLFTMVDDEQGNIFTSLRYSHNDISNFIRKNSYYQNLMTQNSDYYSPLYPNLFTANEYINYSFCYLSKKYEINNIPYIITICYKVDDYIKADTSTIKNSLDSFMVLNKNHQCIYSSNQSIKDSCNEALVDRMVSTKGVITRISGVYFYNKVIATNSIVISYVSTLSLLRSFLTLFIVLIAFCIIQPVLYYLILIPTNGRYLAPLKQLSDDMQKFFIGQVPPDILATEDEIEDLSNVFHDMIIKINLQAKDISTHEHEKAITYYKLLTTQLDPHFIYNTMNIINILARQQQTEDIIEVNTALTRILRERLNTQTTTFSEVKDEIETLKQYNIIMGYRYANSVELIYDIDPDVNDRKIPKNILQPLVENAYYHGLTREDGLIHGSITVMIYPLDTNIIIEISDDGNGIPPEQLDCLNNNNFNINTDNQKNSHIGIANIYNRLQYLYNDNFEMNIQSSLGYGTTVILTLPLVID